MKKTVKISLIILGIGVALFCAGAVLSKMKLFGGNRMKNYVEKKYETVTATSLDLSEISNETIVTRGTGNKLTISYYVPENGDNVDIDEDDGYLTFKRNSEKGFSFSLGFSFIFNHEAHKTTVTLPADFNGELAIKTSSGSIKVSSVDCTSLTVTCSSGSIAVSQINSNSTATLSSTSGSIKVSDLQAPGNCKINSSSGSLSIVNLACAEASLKTTSGSIKVSDLQAPGNCKINSSSGSLSIVNLTCAEASLKTTSGSISFSSLTSDDISLESTSGSIKGNISGNENDYSISVSTTSGSKNLDNSKGGSKSLTAKATSGSIKITFSK